MKLTEIAQRIKAHLDRLAANPETARNAKGHARFWTPNACAAGRYVKVTYVSYQHTSALSKDEALRYLEALDAGCTVPHFSLNPPTRSPETLAKATGNAG